MTLYPPSLLKSIFALFALFLSSLSLNAAPVRMAVLSGPGDANIADLLTAELSHQKEVVLVERDQLEAVVGEWKLKAGGMEDYLRCGQLLKADGLLVVGHQNEAGKSLHVIRLVAVNPGVVIDSLVIPETAEKNAPLITAHFTPFFPKLATLSRLKAVPISLLGVRFELGSTSNEKEEWALNTLLAAGLTHRPEVLVTERWKLNSLGFEKALNPGFDSSPFWTGAYLLDGSVIEKGSQLVIKARLRAGGESGQAINVEAMGDRNALETLADDLAKKIATKIGVSSKPMDWEPNSEAKNFAQLADWSLNNGLYGQALDAVETAVALGDQTPQTALLRIRALATFAFSTDLGFAQNAGQAYPKIQPENAAQQIQAALQAQTGLNDYLVKYAALDASSRGPIWGSNYWDFGGRVIFIGLRMLRGCYESNLHGQHADALTQLRSAVRQNMRFMLDRFPEESIHSHIPRSMAEYVSYWTESPEEAVAAMREVLHMPCRSYIPFGFCLNYGNGTGAGWGIQNLAPLRMAWRPEQESRLETVWQQFIRELLSSSKSQDQIDGLMFAHAFQKKGDDRLAMLFTIQNCLWAHLDEIARNQLNLDGLTNALRESRLASAPAAVRAFPFQLLTHLLQGSLCDQRCGDPLCDHLQWDEAETRVLLPLIDSYLTRAAKARKPKRAWVADLESLRHRLFLAYPNLKPNYSPSDPLAVCRFVDPLSGQEPSAGHLIPATLTLLEGKLWFIATGNDRLWSFDPQTLQASSLELPREIRGEPCGLPAIIPKYLCVCSASHAYIYDRRASKGEIVTIPKAKYRAQFVDDFLYLTFGGGVLKIDPKSRITELFISSRRTPALNSLDGIPLGEPLGMYSRPDKSLMLALQERTYVQKSATVWEPAYWEVVEKGALSYALRNCTDRVLIMAGIVPFGSFIKRNRICSIPPRGEIETLLIDPATAPANRASQARWRCPKSLSEITAGNWQHVSFDMEGEDLWVLADEEHSSGGNANYRLYYFKQGSQEPAEIPLTVAPPSAGQVSGSALDIVGLLATSSGLFLSTRNEPWLWFIPASDLRPYRERLGERP